MPPRLLRLAFQAVEALRDQVMHLARLMVFQDHAPVSDYALVIFGIERPPQWSKPRRTHPTLFRSVIRLKVRRPSKIAFGSGVVPRGLPQAATMHPHPELIESEFQRPVIVAPRFVQV